MATPGSAVNPKAPANTASAANPYATGGTAAALVDAAGDDPWGLGNIFPNVTKKLTTAQREAQITTMTGAQREALAQVLVQAGVLGASSKGYSVTQLQDALSRAFKQAGQAGTGSLSRYVTETVQKAGGSTTSGSVGKVDIPSPTATQTVYTTADITATANDAAQKALGRNATPQEIQAITDQLNAGEAQNTQSELSASEASTAAGSDATNSGSQVDQFLAAIRTHESGGDYKANSGDGAYGAYQYTPGTWKSEATAAGYGQYANQTADKAPPEVQDAVARYDAMNKLSSYGNWKNVAEAWYYPAWAGDPSKQNSVPEPGAGNKQTIGSYGDQIVQMMGEATQAPTSGSGVNSPVGAGLKQGRTDQGVDFTGSGPLYAVGSGQILSTTNAGWPGGAFIALKLDNPIDPQHSVVYYAENIAPNVKVGQKVTAGQQIGTATGASNARGSGIEIGWGDPNAIGSALAHGAGGEGAVTQEGQSFLDYISGGANNQALSAAAKAGGTSYLEALYNQTKTMQNAVDMSGGANNAVIDTKTANDPASVALSYYMNQHSADYQSHNLLGVFSTISDLLKTGGSQAAGVHGTPIDMRAMT